MTRTTKEESRQERKGNDRASYVILTIIAAAVVGLIIALALFAGR